MKRHENIIDKFLRGWSTTTSHNIKTAESFLDPRIFCTYREIPEDFGEKET